MSRSTGVFRRPWHPRPQRRDIGTLTAPAGAPDPVMPVVPERPRQRPRGGLVVRRAVADPLLTLRPWAGAVRTIRGVEESLERSVRG